MGYSVSVRFKNFNEQSLMERFYLENTDIIHALAKAEGRENNVENYLSLHVDNRLSYAPRVKYLLGHDGGAGRTHYFHLLLAWMATKSSYRDKTNNPFIYYDREKIYVNTPNYMTLLVNEEGIQTLEIFQSFSERNIKDLNFHIYNISTDLATYMKKTEEIITLLNERWKKFILSV